eukprot:394427-Pleurochrysis_carterae.AAC.3
MRRKREGGRDHVVRKGCAEGLCGRHRGQLKRGRSIPVKVWRGDEGVDEGRRLEASDVHS